MKISLHILVVLLIISPGCRINKKVSTETELNNIEKALTTSNFELGFLDEIKDSQKKLIAGLTGNDKISQSQTIDRRWTDNERDLARDFLGNMFEELDLPVYQNHYETNKPSYDQPINLLKGANLYTIIPATLETNEYVIIGAHFDTVEESTGASDNASGCALVYGVGKALSRLKERNKNVILIFFDQEERGLLGSLAFVDFIRKEKYGIHSVHTVDMIGWDEDGDRNIEIEKPSSELKSLYRLAADEFNIHAYKTLTTSTDHKAFRDAGFNAVGITEEYKHGDTTPHYHKRSDQFETINFDYLAHTTVLVFTVIKSIVT